MGEVVQLIFKDRQREPVQVTMAAPLQQAEAASGGGRRGSSSRVPSAATADHPIDIDAIARFGSVLGVYVGHKLATERARAVAGPVDIVRQNGRERLDAPTLDHLTEEIRADDLMAARAALGREGARRVAQGLRDALARLMDGP